MTSRLHRLWAMAIITLGVLVRPHYWIVAVRVGRRMVPNRWWSRWPYLPLPTRDFVRFRLETQYGGQDPQPNLPDVLQYLRWVRHWESAT